MLSLMMETLPRPMRSLKSSLMTVEKLIHPITYLWSLGHQSQRISPTIHPLILEDGLRFLELSPCLPVHAGLLALADHTHIRCLVRLSRTWHSKLPHLIHLQLQPAQDELVSRKRRIEGQWGLLQQLPALWRPYHRITTRIGKAPTRRLEVCRGHLLGITRMRIVRHTIQDLQSPPRYPLR